MKRFEIDFFEFCFLVEACIPPKPIARSMFFDNVSDKYYHIMTSDEREKLFNWIQLNPQFSLDKEDCRHFFARFNPDNQWLVGTEFEGEEKLYLTYVYNGEFHTTKSKSIVERYIISKRKISE